MRSSCVATSFCDVRRGESFGFIARDEQVRMLFPSPTPSFIFLKVRYPFRYKKQEVCCKIEMGY